MKYITIIAISLVSILSSCLFSGCPVVELPVHDKIWSLPFKNYDKLTFENTKGQQYIFTHLKGDSTCTPCNKFELGPNQYEKFYVSFDCNETLKTSSGEHNRFSIQASAWRLNNGFAWKRLTLFDFDEQFYTIDSTIKIEFLYCNALGKEIETYFYDKGEYPWPTDEIESVRTVNYSKEFGLIRYTTIKDTFDLIKIN